MSSFVRRFLSCKSGVAEMTEELTIAEMSIPAFQVYNPDS